MPKIDLHIHSTASDGRYQPRDIVYLAVERGVQVIALADHDTIDGIAPALAAARLFPELKLIPAIEISTDLPGDEVHILGYFLDHTHPVLQAQLEKMRQSRIERAKKMIAKLNDMGMAIGWEQVQKFSGGKTIGRPHIAQALIEKGYIATFQEAFTKYIGRNAPAYVSRDKMAPEEAIKLIADFKGVAVLAHPLTVREPEPLILSLIPAGLSGIEVYYKDYRPEQRKYLRELADKHKLAATGGSDFHGLDASEVMLGESGVPRLAVEQIQKLAEQKAKQR